MAACLTCGREVDRPGLKGAYCSTRCRIARPAEPAPVAVTEAAAVERVERLETFGGATAAVLHDSEAVLPRDVFERMLSTEDGA